MMYPTTISYLQTPLVHVCKIGQTIVVSESTWRGQAAAAYAHIGACERRLSIPLASVINPSFLTLHPIHLLGTWDNSRK